jgi:hypothetical protein
MYPPGGPATMSWASRGRTRPALCDHRNTPMLVSAISGGYEAQCLSCGTLGPVRDTSDAARLELLGDPSEHP